MRWYGEGDTLQVGGFVLRNPNVYASPGRTGSSDWATEPSEILLSADVRRMGNFDSEMGYWPWYSRIAPGHRYLYLEWLASGKTSLPRSEGLLFLYFYGLERRLLIDQKEKESVLREIVRLRKLDERRLGTREGNSFRMYSTGLLWFEVARAPAMFDDKAFQKVCDLTSVWNEASLAAAMNWLVLNQKPLGTDLALRIARMNPRSQQSVVVKRVGEQFTTLFERRYTERFAGGIPLRISKRSRRHTYRPASGGLTEVSCSISDVMGIPSQFEPLADIWNSCVDDLRKFSKVNAPSGGTLNVQTWEAMPAELREGADHPLTSRVQGLIVDQMSKPSGEGVRLSECLLSAGTLAGLFMIEKRPKMTTVQSRRLAEGLEQTGHAIEPDARLSNRPYQWDESVAVFLRTEDDEVDKGRYAAASSMLRLGLVVAEADGVVDEEELRVLGEQINATFRLPSHELRRMEALRSLLLKTGSELSVVAERLESSLTPDAKRSVGRLLVAIAAANG